MGGCVPLGYEIRDRRVVILEPEAETVRYIFNRSGGFQLIKRCIPIRAKPL
jgi:hypothetical protein